MPELGWVKREVDDEHGVAEVSEEEGLAIVHLLKHYLHRHAARSPQNADHTNERGAEQPIADVSGGDGPRREAGEDPTAQLPRRNGNQTHREHSRHPEHEERRSAPSRASLHS